MTLNKTQLMALKDSIANWSRLARNQAEPGESIHAADCALCEVFLDLSGTDRKGRFMSGCLGCPIAFKTGRPDCERGPWRAVHEAYVAGGRSLYSDKFRTDAKKMHAFLKSLLPKKKKVIRI